MSRYLTFRKFGTTTEAADIAAILESHNISSIVEETPVLLDAQLIGQQFGNNVLLKLLPEDFTKADELLQKTVRIDTSALEADYYLLSFTTEELQEVVEKKDEWGHFDYALAIQLLEERGVSYTQEQLNTLQHDRTSQLAQPETPAGHWVLIGYLFALLGGLIGIFIGSFLWRFKKTLPDGTRVPAYTAVARKHGLIILCISVGMLIFWISMGMMGHPVPGLHAIFELLGRISF